MSVPTLPRPTALRIAPEPLSAAAFVPFGTVISSPLPPPDVLTATPPLSSLAPHSPAPVLANQSSALKYSPISPLQNAYVECPSRNPAEARMSLFACFPRELRKAPAAVAAGQGIEDTNVFDVCILERHPFTSQTFIPLQRHMVQGGADEIEEEPLFLVLVAPTLRKATEVATGLLGEPVSIQDPPDLGKIKGFIGHGGQAVTYACGTWHAPMAVLGRRRIDFVVVQFVNGVDIEDCQEVAFPEGIMVDLGGLA